MKARKTLLAGAALGALIATGATVSASAAPANHRRAPASSQASEIEALRYQVQALTDRLNMQDDLPPKKCIPPVRTAGTLGSEL